ATAEDGAENEDTKGQIGACRGQVGPDERREPAEPPADGLGGRGREGWRGAGGKLVCDQDGGKGERRLLAEEGRAEEREARGRDPTLTSPGANEERKGAHEERAGEHVGPPGDERDRLCVDRVRGEHRAGQHGGDRARK